MSDLDRLAEMVELAHSDGSGPSPHLLVKTAAHFLDVAPELLAVARAARGRIDCAIHTDNEQAEWCSTCRAGATLVALDAKLAEVLGD